MSSPQYPEPPLGPPAPAQSSARRAGHRVGVTDLLLAWGAGDRGALDALVPLVYAELRRQAARALRREAPGHTLQPTALVHEAYLRLVDQERAPWQSRAQFYGVAARCMRQVLVDHARSRHAAKRGGAGVAITLDNAVAGAAADAVAGEPAAEVLSVHEALDRLSAMDPDQAQLVELRYFGGLTIEETAATLGVSPATVKREWATARAWLRRALEDTGA